jgi:mannan polymerase II complex MNN11 subunit
MHYALPQRKSSQPAPYEVKPKRSLRHDRTFKILSVVGILALIFLLYRLFSYFTHSPSSSLTRAPYGYPNVVVVTTIDPVVEEKEPQLIEHIKANRIEYAAKHGYATFFPSTQRYRKYMEGPDSPSSWARVPAMRHALANFTNTPYFFHVDYKTIIMNLTVSIEKHIMDKKALEENMLVDVPVIPPDSVIKTFVGIPGDKVDMVIAQDNDGLMPNAFVLRRSDWAKFLLDAWFDPMYQSYNFQKAERHALEHIIQCAPTSLH